MRHAIKLLLANGYYGIKKFRENLNISCEDSTCNVPILCYHSVSPISNSVGFRVSPSSFEEQIHYLADHYNVITLNELVRNIYEDNVMKNSVVVTFDDGYRDNYTHAFPILRKYKCPATIFISTAFVQGSKKLIENNEVLEPLTWSEIVEMKESGLVDFGSHGHTHSRFSNISRDEAEKEIRLSKTILEEKLGEEVDLFAYPNGQLSDFNQDTVNTLKQEGFKSACSTVWSTYNSRKMLFSLNRVMIDCMDDMKSFPLKLSGAYDYIWFVHNVKYFLRR